MEDCSLCNHVFKGDDDKRNRRRLSSKSVKSGETFVVMLMNLGIAPYITDSTNLRCRA